MSTTLATLPTELVGCVVANIESKHTLCNLARFSRRFYLCTIPRLYHDVTIQEETKQGDRQKGGLKFLASMLIRRPDLAGLVRTFTLHVTRPPSAEEGYSEQFEEPVGFDDRFYATVFL